MPSRLLKNSNCSPEVHSAAKAAVENGPLIAALKRCATQNRGRHRVFQQPIRTLHASRTQTKWLQEADRRAKTQVVVQFENWHPSAAKAAMKI
jgi:hypothetical protein